MQTHLAIVDDPLFTQHESPTPHPERPERLHAARAALARLELSMARLALEPHDASDDELVRVHSAQYVEQIGRTAGKHGQLDPDTYFVAHSAAAARRAAGGAVRLVDALQTGQAGSGVALLRPPGHHARPHAAMGFCLFNNVAVAAAHARARGVERVLILDWDVHHGNGTQEMFYGDPSVLYASLHQYPFYPGTGAAEEVGEGEGRGFTVNIGLSPAAGDAEYLAAFDRVLAPVTEQFGPQLLLISAGYDAHQRDPLAGMRLSEHAYAGMLRKLRNAAPGVPVGLFLEGGYDLTGLAASLTATLRELDGQADASEPAAGKVSEVHAREISRTERALAPHWRLS